MRRRKRWDLLIKFIKKMKKVLYKMFSLLILIFASFMLEVLLSTLQI